MSISTDVSTPDTAAGQDVVRGLRALADFIDENPHLASHLTYAFDRVLVSVNHTQDARRVMGDFARAAGKAAKTYDEQWAGIDIAFSDDVAIHVYAARDRVCERVVTGTREVTKEIPDAAALAAVPTVTVTETVEDVEWVCAPLLADTQASA